MKALLCAITASVLAMSPFAAKAQVQYDDRDGGHAYDGGGWRSDGGGDWRASRGGDDRWRGGGEERGYGAQPPDRGDWNGDDGWRGRDADGARPGDGWGADYGFVGQPYGYYDGYDDGGYGYGAGAYAPEPDEGYAQGYDERWQGPPAYDEQDGQPGGWRSGGPGGYGDQEGYAGRGGDWSPGAPPADCGRWVWRADAGAYNWSRAPCHFPEPRG